MSPSVSLSINNLASFRAYADALSRMDGPRPRFVEVLWDNYVHIEPDQLGHILHEVADEISLHVMYSGFLGRPLEQVRRTWHQLAAVVRALQPARVSDHLLRYEQPDHLNILTPLEHPYTALTAACDRVREYQDTIGMPLLLENFASHEGDQRRQLDFLDALQARTRCGLLFDVSNAVVAELNGSCPTALWLQYLKDRCVDVHVGGYTYAPKTGRVIDSHAEDLAPSTCVLLEKLLRQGSVHTLCLEREHNVSEDVVFAELSRLNAIVTASAGPPVPPLESRVRRHGSRRLYLSDDPVQLSASAPHPYWHSPFLGPRTTDREGRLLRMRAAGELWVSNYDLEPGAELIIEDDGTATWFLFRRPRCPGDTRMALGPFDGSVLAGGSPLPEGGMRFHVTDQPTSDGPLP